MRPRVKQVLRRALKLTCPVCGRGRMFQRGMRRAERCSACAWRFERCEGHWVGGSELHMLITFGVGTLCVLPVVLLTRFSPWTLALAAVVHTAFSLAIYRWSRSLFLALDYLLDPSDGSGGDDRDRDVLYSPPDPPPRSRARTRISAPEPALAATSVRRERSLAR